MEQVRILVPSERPSLDPDQFAMLSGQLGAHGAEDIVCRAMEELASRMGQLEKHYLEGNRIELRRQTRALAAIAGQIGMATLARVASDVAICIDDCDTVALAATFTRLARVCEISLVSYWDVQDLSV